MIPALHGIVLAILATNGFEKAELVKTRQKLEQLGATIKIISLDKKPIRSWDKNNWGSSVSVDDTVDHVNPRTFNGLVLPGGVINPDTLRMSEKAIAFVRHFVDSGKLIAAICHGPWTLIETGIINGKNVTSWPSIKTDLRNAGGYWVDKPVVIDGTLITSRKPADIDPFVDAIAEYFKKNPIH